MSRLPTRATAERWLAESSHRGYIMAYSSGAGLGESGTARRDCKDTDDDAKTAERKTAMVRGSRKSGRTTNSARYAG